VPCAAAGGGCALDDDTWLHVLRWSRADGEEQLMQQSADFDTITKIHDLRADGDDGVHGEIVHTSG
jgi:hypothetical protein